MAAQIIADDLLLHQQFKEEVAAWVCKLGESVLFAIFSLVVLITLNGFQGTLEVVTSPSLRDLRSFRSHRKLCSVRRVRRRFSVTVQCPK
jgi:hypothetical protein